ncbi:MAG: ABC transporter ATP-binding protein, partial [Chloroflexi bacterium]|nr:ABC transporter ATP-binding protein [Chloroflexota bacterium]
MEPGECLLVVGPSGSGKSTLALAIAGLVPREIPGIFGRTLLVDDVETRHWRPAALAARAGLVFQDPGAQIVMERVEDDVAFGLENRGWSRQAMLARVPVALAAVGLEGLERHRSNRLSGGQQQRLALAGVLAAEPGLLVLDEPTANLDPDAAADLFERLAELRSSRTTTIVLVEHRVDAAWPLADRVLALGHQGEQIDVGRPAEVLARAGRRMAAEGIWLP